MNAMILAAGFGTRFDPESKTYTDKAFLDVCGKPALTWIVDRLNIPDIECIHIICSGMNAKAMKFWNRDVWKKRKFFPKVNYFSTRAKSPDKAAGAVGTFWYGAGGLGSNGPVLLICCDNIFTFPISDFIESINYDHAAICVQDVEMGESCDEYGKVEMDDETNRVLFVHEKKPVSIGTVWLGPAYFPSGWTMDLFEFMEERVALEKDADNLGDFVGWYAQKYPLYAWRPKRGRVFDLGTKTKYEEANRRIARKA